MSWAINARQPDRTIGASMTPFLKLSDVRWSTFCLLVGLGEVGGDGEEALRDMIIRRS